MQSLDSPPFFIRSLMRITFEVSDDTYKKLSVIPHGMKKRCYRVLMEMFAEELDHDSARIIFSVLTKDISFDPELTKTLREKIIGDSG